VLPSISYLPPFVLASIIIDISLRLDISIASTDWQFITPSHEASLSESSIMFKSFVFAAALAASAVAQSTSTISMFVASADAYQYEASVISADSSLTTYAWACVSGPNCVASYSVSMLRLMPVNFLTTSFRPP